MSDPKAADFEARQNLPSKLVQSIARQLDGGKLPNLKELEGTQIVISVSNGRLNWTYSLPHTIEVMCW